jgi:SAM-dependent methyltransferase
MTITTTVFDPARYKATTREQWQSAAKAWNDWGELLRDWLGPATETMLDLAGVGAGSRVLDVAAGAGDQSLQAAERVGDDGYVLATDISSNILEFAAENARKAGLRNIGTQVLDGEDLEVPPGTFDVVISRLGLIYFPDQQRALASMRRALKPGGRIAVIVFSAAENNRFFSVPVSVVRRRANLPPPAAGQPGPFSLGGPGVLEAQFAKAGLRDVETRLVAAPVTLPSAQECVRFEKESFGALHQMLSGLGDEDKEAAWAEIEQELRCFEGPSGFVGPCELLVAVGTN